MVFRPLRDLIKRVNLIGFVQRLMSLTQRSDHVRGTCFGLSSRLARLGYFIIIILPDSKLPVTIQILPKVNQMP